MSYKAPVKDIEFAMNAVCGFKAHYDELIDDALGGADLVEAIVPEFARFCEKSLEPLNRVADEEGCQWIDGEVKTPPGFKEVYQQYIEAGWTSLSCEPDYGGQGLPTSLALILGEMMGSSNISFTLYTGGLSGAIETLSVFAKPDMREIYERPLISGQWNATMCLTEPHCGTDLGLLKTKAAPNPDGSYHITGTKIFITAGEHDLTENIVHLVLARMPDAPAGTKGISLFIVPKLYPSETGSGFEENNVSCGSIEHKMGIKGSATCVMNFDGARGHLLGDPNRGLNAMFKFINASRIRAAFQGVSHAELGFQKSLAYAHDRLQMRSLSGPKNSNGPADPIIVHPNVRRMLLTQKVFAEGNRVMLYYLARQLDVSEHSMSQDDRKKALSRLELLTPIAKGFATETGVESANLALQCFGGHGYIREWGVEQNLRDSRIATLYEGTTGIQALDLLSRKVLGSNGALLKEFCDEIIAFCNQADGDARLERHVKTLRKLVSEWLVLTSDVGTKAKANPEEIGAASLNYLMYAGYICLAFCWLQSAVAARRELEKGSDREAFLVAKLKSADFYFDHIVPRTRSCVEIIENGADSLMALDAEHFAF